MAAQRCPRARIVPGVSDVQVVGDGPLVDGMSISVRLRRDFTVTDAGRLLIAGRRMFRELHPGASPADAVGPDCLPTGDVFALR
jgi:hypothetical protein